MESCDSINDGAILPIVIVRFASDKSSDLSTPAESVEVEGFHTTITNHFGKVDKAGHHSVERCLILEEVANSLLEKIQRKKKALRMVVS